MAWLVLSHSLAVLTSTRKCRSPTPDPRGATVRRKTHKQSYKSHHQLLGSEHRQHTAGAKNAKGKAIRFVM